MVGPTERSQTADRAAQVLLAVAQNPQNLSQLTRTLDVERRALGRIVASLEEYGLLRRVESSGAIELGGAAMNLGRTLTERRNLVEISRAPLETLMHLVKCTTIIHERVGNYLVPRLILAPTDVLAVSYPAGRSIALWQGIGRTVLATLSAAELEPYLRRAEISDAASKIAQTRVSGIAVSYGEVTEGLTAVGSAVLDADGGAIAVVAIVALASTRPEAHAQAVLETSELITSMLARPPEPGLRPVRR